MAPLHGACSLTPGQRPARTRAARHTANLSSAALEDAVELLQGHEVQHRAVPRQRGRPLARRVAPHCLVEPLQLLQRLAGARPLALALGRHGCLHHVLEPASISAFTPAAMSALEQPCAASASSLPGASISTQKSATIWHSWFRQLFSSTHCTSAASRSRKRGRHSKLRPASDVRPRAFGTLNREPSASSIMKYSKSSSALASKTPARRSASLPTSTAVCTAGS